MGDSPRVFDAALIRDAGSLWRQATQSPFLESVARGDLAPEAFARWLAQDYLFAGGLLEFQAIVVSKVPRPCHSPLIAGLTALDLELGWFESHAARLKLDLSIEPHPACRRYCDFLLHAAHTSPFAVLLAIVFGVEVSYLAAWSALKAAGPYAEFIERWSNPAFADYVASLEALAERYKDARQQAAFNRVLELERDFWRMSWEG